MNWIQIEPRRIKTSISLSPQLNESMSTDPVAPYRDRWQALKAKQMDANILGDGSFTAEDRAELDMLSAFAESLYDPEEEHDDDL